MSRRVLLAMTAVLGVTPALGQVEAPPSAIIKPSQPADPDSVQAPPGDEAQLRQLMETKGNGSVAVQAVQGTPYGPNVGVAPVEITLVHRGQIVKTVQGQLDEYGVAVVEGLPVAMEVTPIVQVKYGGVLYQATGPVMTPEKNSAKVEVTVYETTDVKPDWRITMRHVMVHRMDDGLMVAEMIVINNPGEQTWLGGEPVDTEEDEMRPAAEWRIAKGAQHVQLIAGFHGWCCTTLDDAGNMAVGMPMMPGQSRFRVAYQLPITDKSINLEVTAPVPTDHIMALFVDDGTSVTGENMTDAGTQVMEGRAVRIFQAESLEPGQSAGVLFAGLAPPVDLTAASSTAKNIKLIAAVAGGIVLLAGIVVVLVKGPKRRDPAGGGAAGSG